MSKNVTMRGSIFLNVLDQHLLPFFSIHQCHHLMCNDVPYGHYHFQKLTNFTSNILHIFSLKNI